MKNETTVILTNVVGAHIKLSKCAACAEAAPLAWHWIDVFMRAQAPTLETR
jgi:hypothetical protein